MERIAADTSLQKNPQSLRLRKHFISTEQKLFRGRLLLQPAVLKPLQNHVWDFPNHVKAGAFREINFTKLIEIVKETSIGPIIAEPFLNKQEMHLYDILVVEEDEMSRLIMGMLLRRNYLTFKFAYTPEEAVEKFLGDQFHLIVIGVDNPEIVNKGLTDLLARTRIPALALCTDPGKEEIPAILQSGFRDLLSKPYSEQDLLKLIHNHMKNDTPPKKEVLENGSGADAETFNLDQLNRIGNNDRGFIIKMLDKFIISATECSEALRAAIPARDWKAMKAAAHKSIPSFSLMGLNGLMHDLEYIDQHAGEPEQENEVLDRARKAEEKNKKVIADVNAHIRELKDKNE